MLSTSYVEISNYNGVYMRVILRQMNGLMRAGHNPNTICDKLWCFFFHGLLICLRGQIKPSVQQHANTLEFLLFTFTRARSSTYHPRVFVPKRCNMKKEPALSLLLQISHIPPLIQFSLCLHTESKMHKDWYALRNSILL
jgi:hypothetical protein